MKTHPKPTSTKGFALVVTLTLMILLTVVAVGLLTLSSITMRTVGQGASAAMARANARVALMLAIGELQKATGQDRAITAPSSIVEERNPMGVTGVWTPWTLGSTGASRTRNARNDNFRQWLVSTTDGQPASARTTPPLVAAGTANAVTLLGKGSLGNRNTEKNDDQRITLPSTRVVNGKSRGGLAWAVIDESVKARADLYEKDPTAASAAVLRVGSPPANGVAALVGLDKLIADADNSPRMVSMNNAGLVLGTGAEKLKVYSPDLTVSSSSLMTDVVSGGLKKDLSLWFSKGLTSSEKTTKLYKGSETLTTSYPSDPAMSLLETYHDYYENIGKRGAGTASPPAGGVVAKLPTRYTASRADVASPNAPIEPLMVPTLLRVDLIFSLIARDVHSGRAAGLIAAGRPYMLHLLYLPVVTIHNPYSVPMSLEGLKVTFKNVPIAFQFLVDGQPLTTGMVPLNQLYGGSSDTTTKDFSFTLGSSLGSGSSSSLVLQAGQTKLFGTPKVPSTWTWFSESPGAGADGTMLFDYRSGSGFTTNFQMAPKLMTDAKTGAGFDTDWLAPTGLQTAMGNTCGRGEGIVSLTGAESLGVRYGPTTASAASAANNSFNVKVELKQNGAFVEAGALSIKYGNVARLKTIVEQGTSTRLSTPRSFPETFPKPSVDPRITANSIYEPGNRAIKDYIRPKPFAIFSVGSRTTKESFVPTRTIADGNPVMNVANIDLSAGKDPIGGVPLEMVMMPIRNGNAAIEDIRATEEGFAFSGNGSLLGSPRATFYEIPRAPLQSIAQFRNANLAGSGYMPLTTYTVGESRAHPQIGTDQVNFAWTDRSMMLDHTWLANESLWDRYFLSTIAGQTTTQFAKAKSYKEVMTDFFAQTSRLPNQRFSPYHTGAAGTPPALESATDPQDVIAASLMLQGGFNVNSTSKDAWIAVLSGLRNAAIETQAGTEAGQSGFSAFPRMRRPVGKNIDSQTINDRVASWEGYRALSDASIVELAGEITKEIRERGPFLSLADFINRGVGPESEETNVKGALQAAIDRLPAINEVADKDGIVLAAAQIGSHGYQSLQAGLGNTATNAPGSLTQGDLLTGLGSGITVRSDTFSIRAYGEARDTTGNTVVARAWCEAVVQRVPEYVDPNDDPSVKQAVIPAAGGTGTPNERFGRRYQIVSFRWLAPDEV